MSNVVLIDYGSGNLPSARKALAFAADDAARVVVSDDPEIVAKADRVVLPGVGAFTACMKELEARPGLIEAMNEAVRSRGAPFLGVCVGMQLLLTGGLGGAQEANPFFASSPPPTFQVAWAVGWIAVCLLLAIGLFRRREL